MISHHKREHTMINRTTVKHSFISSLPVMAGYIVLGMGFGFLLSAEGYSFWWAILMSVTIFAGAMQYVGVSLLASGASIFSTALMTLMVNARHIFYGISMIKRYKDMGWRKPYAIFGLTDETYSLVCVDNPLPEGVDRRDYCFLLTLMNQCYWIFGAFLGAFCGNTFSFNVAGLDFSMTAIFVCIFVEQWEKNKQHFPAIFGLVVSLVCLIVFGADQFLIPTMIAICCGMLLFRKKLEQGELSQ